METCFQNFVAAAQEEEPVAREQRKLAAILAADVVGYSRQTARR
jgi:class 3 adenylate cyclase